MENNLYEYFNDIDMDMESINLLDIELDELTKKRIKNNLHKSLRNKKSTPKKIIVGAAMVVFLAGVVTVYSPQISAFADNIPVLNTLFHEFKYSGEFENYTEVINKSIVDKGYEVTINEAVMDDFSFKLIYTIKTPEKIEDLINNVGVDNPFPYTPGTSITLNNKKFLGGAGGSHRIIDEHTVQVINDFDIEDTKIPANFTIDIKFNKINNIAGNWDFSFNMSKEKINKDIKSYDIDKKLKIKDVNNKDMTLTFNKLSFSPISTAILIKGDGEFDYTKVKFKAEDGTELNPTMYSFDVNANFIYSAKALYKFEPITTIPNKIILEYTDNDENISSMEVELN
ncbi:DUF4179 domain-containing protein [Clostridium intestinale]|uniref:DUF4179 domain-containing protein n=1 Tax=Clostridium intestinale TaxID=36845 RepID=UPI002DD64157|nr:DUF4179 domain-containing protein [Clostridium intestinale]WRY50549.1 DUF4179 domain-containing protein [Clostridium intestinale]